MTVEDNFIISIHYDKYIRISTNIWCFDLVIVQYVLTFQHCPKKTTCIDNEMAAVKVLILYGSDRHQKEIIFWISAFVFICHPIL